VGWRVAAHMRTTMVLDAIEMTLSERQHITTSVTISTSNRQTSFMFTIQLQRNPITAIGSAGYDPDDPPSWPLSMLPYGPAIARRTERSRIIK
jgi:hypothetical protein